MELWALIREWASTGATQSKGVASLLMVIAAFAARWALLRSLHRSAFIDADSQLRWTRLVRRLTWVLLVGGIAIIWASELRDLALSVVAVAAAMVLATKELIMCVSGTIVRTTSNAYTVGDRIELDGTRGDVVDIGLLTTRVLEIGPGQRRTGRAVVIPHSLLLNKSVINETFTDAYVVHTVAVPVGQTEPWEHAEARLLRIANAVCAPYLEDAREHMEQSALRHAIPSFNIAPTATLQVLDDQKLRLLLRLPTRAQEKGQNEQLILRRFLAEVPRADDAAPVPEAAGEA